MPIEQHAELIDAVHDVGLGQDVRGLLRLPLGPGHLVQREHRVVAGVIGVVAGRPVRHLAVLAEREVVRDRDRFVVGDHKAVLRLGGRSPGSHPGAGARLGQVDGGLAAEIMMMAARRKRLLVRAPAQLGGLHAFGYEAFDRPCVDEGPVRLGLARALGIAFGDVDALDAGALHELRPSVAGVGLVGSDADITHDIEQRALDHPGDHARIGTATAHRRDPAGSAPTQLDHAFTQRIVRTRRRRQGAVGIEAGPGLDHRIDVERIDVPGELHQLDRRGVDRQIHHQAAPGPKREQGREHVAIVRLGQCHMDKSDLPLVEQRAIVVVRRDHHELGAIENDVPLDQRQGAFADRAEPDHHDRAIESRVHRPVLGRMCGRLHAHGQM